MRLFLLAVLLVPGASAQTTPSPSFEAASIKPPRPLEVGQSRSNRTTRAGIDWVADLRRCVAFAYGVREYQVSGPSWMADSWFEIVTRAPAGSREADLPEMMRALLIERFKLEAHKETKEFPGFGLVVAKDGPKMTVAAPPGASGGGPIVGNRMSFRPGRGGTNEYRRTSMEILARSLSLLLGRPVLDETRLTGRYDFSLEYSDTDAARGTAIRAAGAAPPPPDTEPGLSVFTSTQSLGLRLEARKVPGDLIVVDRIAKTPTEN
jgi:uncharacterized protein (TIGR03435 family)